jgi:hypothetical protein
MTKTSMYCSRKLGSLVLGLGACRSRAGRCLECPKQRLLDNLDCAATPPYPLLDNHAPVPLYTDDTRRCAYFDCYRCTHIRPRAAPDRPDTKEITGHRHRDICISANRRLRVTPTKTATLEPTHSQKYRTPQTGCPRFQHWRTRLPNPQRGTTMRS